MLGEPAQLVEQAIATVWSTAVLPQQADLLSILGVFAEPLIAPDRFVRMVGKERLMASDLLTYLMDEKITELQAEKQSEIAELRAELEAEKLRQFQQALEEGVVARFPEAPPVLLQHIRRITDTQQL